ncbi:MAG: pseudouridine synthase [Gallionellaceae bacterium]|nr:MAG: pseudouridine synthase [Gallionellaceae bacterium]
MSDQQEMQEPQGERLQKILAQAGVGSRREMEEWIVAGRVTLNGEVATLGMRAVAGDMVCADKRVIHVKGQAAQGLPRVLLYHKQEGEIVSRADPKSRSSVFDNLPKLRGQKWIAIGRLDFNTSGLLIFTTSGELANRLMHPRFEVEREYAVRVQGGMTPEQMKQMTREGIELEDGVVKFSKLSDEGGEGFNHWYRIVIKEGRNREVRRTFEALGLTVSRLMRVRFGIVNLPPSIKRGKMAELGEGEVKMILDWVGLASEAFEQPEPAKVERPRPGSKPSKEKEPGEAKMPVARKTAGRRGQVDMSRARAHRKIKTGAKS